MRPLAAVYLLLLMLAGQALAAQPRAGDKAPDFSLSSLEGTTVALSDVIAKGPVVLLVLRGFPGYQCPICSRQVQDFLANANAFAAAGTRVVMVYPGPGSDLKSRAAEFTAGRKMPEHFEFLIDPGYQFTNLYGLRWEAPRETAYPSTFLIDRRGIVRFAKISDSHGGRTSAAEVIGLLAKFNGRE
jgi:thioredoxin-dependent peroxiredoxin